VIATLNGRFRYVTTSLLGYGGTAERRTAGDPAISHEAEILESVVRRAGGRAHLVGHSFGGLVALAVAFRNQVSLASLVIVDAPALDVLRDRGEREHYRAFREMTKAYFAAFAGGNVEAIAAMIDFTVAPAPMPRGRDECATTPWRRQRSTSSIGRVRMVSRCRGRRWLPSKSRRS